MKAEDALAVFIRILKDQGYKRRTIECRLSYLKHLVRFMNQNGIENLNEIHITHIEDFYSYLKDYISTRTGKPLSPASIQMILASLKLLFNSLFTNELVTGNPARDLNIRIKYFKPEKPYFSVTEMNRFLDSIDINKDFGLRDRAIFELAYSSALRISELSNLNIEDIDFNDRTLIVRQGKFSKDRIVAVTVPSIKFLKKYSDDRTHGPLFLSNRKTRLGVNGIQKRFRIHKDRAGIIKQGLTVHSIRHSCATHLLEAGANIRYVQELLGHESIETTVVYTHMAGENIKRDYKRYHPRENELYLEVDDNYRTRIAHFKAELIKQRQKRINRNRKKIDGKMKCD